MNVERLALHRHCATFDLGDIQQRVDDIQQMLARGLDDAGIFQTLLGFGWQQRLVAQHLRKADDRI
jgi:hypothetical protein